MSTVEQIECAIGGLPRDQFFELIAWIRSRYKDERDRRIENDSNAGRQENLAREALAEYQAGHTTVTVQTEYILKKVLGLPPIERAEMVEQILASFDFPTRRQIDEAWAKEAEDRIDAYDRGDIKAIPASAVFEKIEQQYSK